jgi:catechol 2,3-dioxygenase-like lactoylglutathione lyase family enzyme
MKLTAIRPMLWTENLTETVEFYTRVLGFICRDMYEFSGSVMCEFMVCDNNVYVLQFRQNLEFK